MVLTYKPWIIQHDKTEEIIISSEELGNFPYTLHLTAEEPIPEKTVFVSAEIGRSAVALLTVSNTSSTKEEFFCKVC